VCTQIGSDHFAFFATTGSKSRLNCLELLRADHGDYVINEAALSHMPRHSLSGVLIALLAGHETHRFAALTMWQDHLERPSIPALKVRPDPLKIATEGALWGSIVEHALLGDAVILSDDAGQFNVGRHALCWGHAERLIHKLDGFTDWQHQAQERIRSRLWRLYADLKAYCRDPTPQRKHQLKARFDRIFTSKTSFATLDRLLERLHANKAERLRP
jgi:hypothetical protein